MRILYAVQGSGHGHLARAGEIYPELCRHGEVDVLVSGPGAQADLPFPVRHRLHGLSFILGDNGRFSAAGSARKLRLRQAWRDMRSLELRKHYDLVINDFEPVSAWAARCSSVPCIALSHQWAVRHGFAPKPELAGDWKGESILKHFAPSDDGFGFHFKSYSKKIFTPVIRREVREMQVTDEGHYTVYLPAYEEAAVLAFLQKFEKERWEVFSQRCREESVQGNVRLRPIGGSSFLQSMASSAGVLTSAGFECPAEALFLGKKLMVVPMEHQYEQQCNAAALATLSVPAIKKISMKYYDRMNYWLTGGIVQVAVDYPDQTAMIADTLITDFLMSREGAPAATLRLG